MLWSMRMLYEGGCPTSDSLNLDIRSVAAGVLAVLESGLIIRKIASLLFFFAQ